MSRHSLQDFDPPDVEVLARWNRASDVLPVRNFLDYNPSTGRFTWKATPSIKAPLLIGKEAGCLNAAGYRIIGVQGRRYRACRLAWLWVHGRWPEKEIDHINGVPDDDRIDNLREADRYQNNANTRRSKSNTSGHKGVDWCKRDRKWRARFAERSLGYFDTPEAAAEAYEKEARKLRGEFARVG